MNVRMIEGTLEDVGPRMLTRPRVAEYTALTVRLTNGMRETIEGCRAYGSLVAELTPGARGRFFIWTTAGARSIVAYARTSGGLVEEIDETVWGLRLRRAAAAAPFCIALVGIPFVIYYLAIGPKPDAVRASVVRLHATEHASSPQTGSAPQRFVA